jgi:hypothetical protein
MREDMIATCDEIDAEIVRVLTEKFSLELHRATRATLPAPSSAN